MRDIGPWSGFYLGATAGYGWGQGRADGDLGRIGFDQSGGLGTIFAGYNWQMGRAVIGAEADIGTGSLKSSTVSPIGTFNTELNSNGSIRGRAGLLLTPALLLYGTAGFGWANYDVGIDGFKSQSKTFTGLQVGAGAELMLSVIFDTIGVRRLEARAALDNPRATGALRKVGATPEAQLRRSFLVEDEEGDDVLWSVLVDEWRARTSGGTRNATESAVSPDGGVPPDDGGFQLVSNAAVNSGR